MKFKTLILLITAWSTLMATPIPSLYDCDVVTIHQEKTTLAPYKGKVLLIVNTASGCGFTPQFEGLEKLYTAYKSRGFVVLGFPSNQFAGQEPLDEKGIENFCRVNYGVTFPLFAKIEVNGNHTHPLYTYLKRNAKGILGSEAIKWNFTKFLVTKEGKVIRRYAPSTAPEAIASDIETLLKKGTL
jgi:glutathione peroxidase